MRVEAIEQIKTVQREDNGKFVFLSVAAIVRNNQLMFLQACKKLIEQQLNVVIHLAGPITEEYSVKVKEYIANHRLENHINCLDGGWISNTG